MNTRSPNVIMSSSKISCGSVMKQDTSLADERIESYDTLIGLLS